MKQNVWIIVCLALVTVLTSCATQNEVPTEGNVSQGSWSEISSTGWVSSVSQETGSVVLEITNPSPLAGKTLNFEVTLENIEKAEGNEQTDTVESEDNIEVNYIGTLEDGEKFDSSFDRNETLPFTVGVGQMIPGFDAWVVGMKLGETKSLVLSPEEAYGPEIITDTLTISELRSYVGPDFDVVVGGLIPTAGGNATIIEIQD